ncbi:MAG: hypothetical protein ACLRHW_15915 [Coprobacillus cateniformis]
MNREQLQSYIYTEKLLAQLYRQAAAMATLQSERRFYLHLLEMLSRMLII